MNKQVEPFDFDSVYFDMKYKEIPLTFTAEYVCLSGVWCSHVIVVGPPVRLSRYPM